MSNVTQLSTARQSDAGQKPRSDTINPVAQLVAAIDKAFGDKWSFDLVHHETAGDETIVFTKLVVDGRYRIGIGGTSEKGTLVHRLNAAAVDALARAAEWMGIEIPDDNTHITAPAAPRPVSSATTDTPDQPPTRLSRKQLDFIYSLARGQGIARDQVAARCLELYERKPEYLSKQQASDVIRVLQNKGGAS